VIGVWHFEWMWHSHLQGSKSDISSLQG